MSGVLVYDGDCGFCTRTAGWVARGGVAVLASRALDQEALDRLGLTRADLASAAWWLGVDEPPRRGARAVSAALRARGSGWRVLGQALDLPGVRLLAVAGYALVVRHRHHLSALMRPRR